jgi:sulfatase modifying factor 1
MRSSPRLSELPFSFCLLGAFVMSSCTFDFSSVQGGDRELDTREKVVDGGGDSTSPGFGGAPGIDGPLAIDAWVPDSPTTTRPDGSGGGTGGRTGSSSSGTAGIAGMSGGADASAEDVPALQPDGPIGGTGGTVASTGVGGAGGGMTVIGGSSGARVDAGVADSGTPDAPTVQTGGSFGGAGGTSGSAGAGGVVGGTSGSAGTSSIGASPSCSGLAATCGPTGNENCCASMPVPGGTFYRGYDGNYYADMTYPATVSAFSLDKYEVTVGRFRSFVNAGKGIRTNPPGVGDGAHPLIAGTGWDATWNSSLLADTDLLKVGLQCNSDYQRWTNAPGANENAPINCVSWYEAFAFCAWDGGRLATETEWNYVAAGGSEQRAYPWGSTPPDPTVAAFNCLGDGVPNCAPTDIVPVGTKPLGDGKWGHADLGGNLYEWVFDWFGYFTLPCKDCLNTRIYLRRVRRGGSYADGAADQLTSARQSDEPEVRWFNLGIRCARSGSIQP